MSRKHVKELSLRIIISMCLVIMLAGNIKVYIPFNNIVILYFRCGYATVHNVLQKDLEDRMESFFLSETCKYLYLVSTG